MAKKAKQSKRAPSPAPVPTPSVPDLMHIERKIDERFESLTGHNSALSRAVTERDVAKKRFEACQLAVDTELRKLQAVYAALNSTDLQAALAIKPYDPLLQHLAEDYHTKEAIATLRKGATDAQIDYALRKALQYYGAIEHRGFKFGRRADDFAVAISGSRLADASDDIVASGAALIADIRRVHNIPDPTKAKADKSRAAGSRASPEQAWDAIKSVATPATQPKRRKADKTAEVREAAKTTSKPASANGITKATLTYIGDGQYKLTYRKDGHTRSKLSTRSTTITKGEALASLAKSVGVEPSAVTDKTNQPDDWSLASTKPEVYAAPSFPPTTQQPPSAKARPSPRMRSVSDGRYLYADAGYWHVDDVRHFALFDHFKVIPIKDDNLEDAVRAACKVLEIDPRDLRVIDDECNVLPGTAADLLSAEAAAEADAPAQAPAESPVDAA